MFWLLFHSIKGPIFCTGCLLIFSFDCFVIFWLLCFDCTGPIFFHVFSVAPNSSSYLLIKVLYSGVLQFFPCFPSIFFYEDDTLIPNKSIKDAVFPWFLLFFLCYLRDSIIHLTLINSFFFCLKLSKLYHNWVNFIWHMGCEHPGLWLILKCACIPI